jgi:tetraacyldisaccharide 4'-kinase
MRAPDFWRADARSPWPTLLAPASLVWRVGARLRRRRPQRVAAKVISVGNLVVGGAGKTPTALALAERLLARGHVVHFITRGYGGRERGPLRVDIDRHVAAEVGDEPLLLAARAPTWVARDRAAGAEAAIAAGAKVLVLDDAHQNFALHKDLSLLVVDAGYGFGNGRVMPAGPLRETVAAGLARAQGVVLIGAGDVRTGNVPQIRASVQPANDDLRHRRVFAFAGIGRPEKFFATLRDLQCDIVATRSYPDHYAYTPDEVMRLAEAAAAAGARLVTTEKDLVRLPPEARRMAQALTVRLAFADGAMLDHVLGKAGIA